MNCSGEEDDEDGDEDGDEDDDGIWMIVVSWIIWETLWRQMNVNVCTDSV